MLRQGVNRNAASRCRFAACRRVPWAAAGADFRKPPRQGLAFAAPVGLGEGEIDGRIVPLPRKPGRGLPFVMLGPMEKIPMTRAGFTALDEELKVLKSVERPAVIRAIAEAREHGDLSENAEYHAAREKQSFIEGRIKELEGMLSLADVIDPSKLSGAVKFGATVTIVDEDSDEERTYQIVGEAEADIERGLLNIRSPLARALIGKDEGDSVEVKTPGGQKSYEILSIRYL
jgi:transcription elongation factor GreA